MPPKAKKGKGKEKEKGAPPAPDAPPPKPKKIPPPPACFTPDDLAKFKEVYVSFDEDNIGKVPLPSIPIMLRKLGFNPKPAEIKEMFRLFLEDDLVDTVEYHEFLFMIEAKTKFGDDFEADVFKALAALGHDDEETGTCSFDTVREEMFTWGDPFIEIEFIDWVKLAMKDKTLKEDGTFAYTKFVENMNAKDQKFLGEPINFFKLDQKTLAAMAIAKAAEEKAEMEKKEAEKKAREEAKRQKMIEAGLIN